MNKDISFKSLKDIKPALVKFYKQYGKHTVFAAIILVLLLYVLVAYKISSLANAEPDPGQTSPVTTVIPKIDQNTINHIQSLEANNVNLQNKIDQARNNPFQE